MVAKTKQSRQLISYRYKPKAQRTDSRDKKCELMLTRRATARVFRTQVILVNL